MAERDESQTRAKVVSNTDPSRVRTVFEGLARDARKFVRDNFPLPHVEPPNQDPGVPDVKLVHEDGTEETFHADDGWNVEKDTTTSPEPVSEPVSEPVEGADPKPASPDSEGSVLA